ncbi:MAG: cobalt ECF transporter T component CbiQ [Candidatus Omnitrophica bacterium]|jgi:cobalt/nickel transport system permease protein|nr:cobalt ECF transporter T component CbiQ [Candidatus Omnitrophota bacterium]
MKNNFIQRTLISALSFLKDSLFADELALKKGFLQSLDARIKTLIFAWFIIAVLLTKNINTVLCLYFLCIFLSSVSKINLGFFLKRTWLFIPFFSLLIGLPALFSVFTPGESLFNLQFGSFTLVITRPGVFTVLLFVLRVTTSVSFIVLLSITTKHFELLKVLRVFGLPQAFTMVLGICYRYIYLFIGIIENTYLAMKSRVGNAIYCKRGQHIVAWNIASLWLRSYQLNEDVYRAMLSRGYSGEPVVLSNFKTRFRDWLFLTGGILLGTATIFL